MKWFLGLALLLLPAVVSTYEYERGPVPKGEGPFPCPGLYCGRSELNDTHLSRFDESLLLATGESTYSFSQLISLTMSYSIDRRVFTGVHGSQEVHLKILGVR